MPPAAASAGSGTTPDCSALCSLTHLHTKVIDIEAQPGFRKAYMRLALRYWLVLLQPRTKQHTGKQERHNTVGAQLLDVIDFDRIGVHCGAGQQLDKLGTNAELEVG